MKRIVSIVLVLVMMSMSQLVSAGGAGEEYYDEPDMQREFFGTIQEYGMLLCQDDIVEIDGMSIDITNKGWEKCKDCMECDDKGWLDLLCYGDDKGFVFVPAKMEYNNPNTAFGKFGKVHHAFVREAHHKNSIVFENGIEKISVEALKYSGPAFVEVIVIPESVKNMYIYSVGSHGDSFVGNDAYKNTTFYVKSGSYAEWYLKQYGFNVKDYVSLSFNGNQVYSDQPAVISGGRTLVPLRAALEMMGATVNWDNATRTVTSKLGNTEVKLAIGSNQMYVNGVAKTIDVPAQLMNNRTMIPIRAVAEAFGCKVGWDNNTRTATIEK